MRLAIRLLFLVLIVYFGIKCVRLEWGGYNLGIFFGLRELPFAVLTLVTLAVLLIDISSGRIYRSVFQYSITAIGLGFILVVGLKKVQHYRVGTSPTWLQVANLPGAPYVMEMDFKTTGAFRLIEYDPTGRTLYYGRYRRKGDTVYITQTNYAGSAGKLPQNGVLRGDTLVWLQFEPMVAARKTGK